MSEKNQSSSLWIIDDPITQGNLLGYIRDNTYETDYPVIDNGHKIYICGTANREEVVAEIELPGQSKQMISASLYEGISTYETDLDSTKPDLSLSGDISIFKTEPHIVSNEPEEIGCFHAILLDIDDQTNIQCLMQKEGDERAYNCLELRNSFDTDITKLIQICDSGDPENPLIVGLNEKENTLIAHNANGAITHSISFPANSIFYTLMSPGIRFVGYSGSRILFLDINDDGFEEVGSIDLSADNGFFFDSIKSHDSDSPLISFYDGKKINYVNPHDMLIQASVSIEGAKPGIDSVCFPTDTGITFIENTLVSHEEMLARPLLISEQPMTPILRFQMGSYDGGLFGFIEKVGTESLVKLFHVYPYGQQEIREYTFSNIQENIQSIDFCSNSKKLYLFANDVYLETEHISRWKPTNTIKLYGFED
jgi:hypothetical protein